MHDATVPLVLHAAVGRYKPARPLVLTTGQVELLRRRLGDRIARIVGGRLRNRTADDLGFTETWT